MIHPAEAFDAYKLIKNQWKSIEEMQQIQNMKLRKLIKHSYENVPYYHQLFNSLKLKPEDIQSVEDLKKLPLLSKRTMRSIPLEQKIAKGICIKKCKTAITSGSTSVPLQVYFTYRDARMIGIALVRSFLAFGAKLWHRVGEFPREVTSRQKRGIFDRVGIWRSWKLPGWDEPKNWIKNLQSWQPQILYGYFKTLRLLAEIIIESGIEDINPQIIISTAGILDEESRNLLSTAFQARIFDLYGSWEGGNIAWECLQCSGLHINSDMVILEVLKDGKPVPPGKEGEVVITNLHSYAMPFIRYRQEDIVVLSKKNPVCDRPFPLIKRIEGRVADYIVLPSGERLTPHPFIPLMFNIPGIDQYQIVQEKIDLLSIKIVPLKDFNKSNIAVIEGKLRKLVGRNMRINISLVKKIDESSSYKRRNVISKVLEKTEI
jgi:phenylacetate-CoA ligase